MANQNDQAVKDYLRTISHEALKLHRVYDNSNRCIEQYECPTWTPDGGTCMLTTYAYDSASVRVIGMKETLASWDAAWDI